MFLLSKVSLSTFVFFYGFVYTNAWFFNGGSSIASELDTGFRDLVPYASENVETTDDSDAKDPLNLSFLPIVLRGFGLPADGGWSALKQFAKEPWWRGANVCTSKVEEVTNNTQAEVAEKSPFIFFGNAAFSTCRNTLNKYICTNKVYSREQTKTTEVVYFCCPGTRKNHETGNCEKVDIKPLEETANKLGSSEFARAMGNYVKKSVLETPNMTVFIPSDKAVNTYLNNAPKLFLNEMVVHAVSENKTGDDNSLENEIPVASDVSQKQSLSSGIAITSERALNHFVPGVYDIHDLENEEILKTIDGLPIRVNIYHGEKKPIITANCAVVKTANHPIENNGMLHITDAILPQVTKSIRDILLESKDFGKFTEFASDADLLEKLGEPGNYTVFAATDAAFDQLSEEMKTKLKKGKSCIQTMMKAHVIPRTLCSGAFGKLTVMTRSLSGNWLTIERENSSLLVGRDSKTEMVDIVASNGVIHVIDHPIVPKSAQPVTSLLANRNHTKWLDLMKKAGFAEESDNAINRTMFVPSEEAIEKAKLEDLDTESLKDVISLHISEKPVCSCQMKNNLMIPSLKPEDELRITTYESNGALFVGLDPKIMVQCATITDKDEKACDTMVHEIDRVLKPAKQSIFEKINNEPSLSKLKGILDNTTVYEELKNGSLGPVTLLAPSESAFANLTTEDWKTLEDKNVADELLRRHIITDVVCCDGVGMASWPFSEEVSTANGFSMSVRRKNKYNVIFGETTTESCDHLTTDGIIHYVDKVLMPRPISLKGSAVKYMDPSGSEIVLFGL
ncbi:periostin [Planococcus citri]|uniref:periostin n=1 Tax=Planococcus citri TaxID=170843 RepID=UPI0031F99024